MQLPLPIVIPLGAAFVYAFAALVLKRATAGGTGPWRVSFVANWAQAAAFAPFLIFGHGAPFTWAHVSHAMLTGMAFFVGQIFTFLAISRGDVSVATPVLGTKVIFVALLTVLLLHQPIPAVWWGAALLTATATALMGSGGRIRTGQDTFARSLIYGFSAAAAFSLTDVLSQKWAPSWGFVRFAPCMFLTVALLSLGLIPRFRGSLFDLPPRTWRWLIAGSALLSLQAGGVAVSIMTFGNATLVNILYSSRGLWTVLLVWLAGHWFGNEEREHGHGVMARRLLGAALLLVAVVLVVR